MTLFFCLVWFGLVLIVLFGLAWLVLLCLLVVFRFVLFMSCVVWFGLRRFEFCVVVALFCSVWFGVAMFVFVLFDVCL